MTLALSSTDRTRAQHGAYLGLFCCGLWVTAFGPGLPFIARQGDVGLGTAGLVITALAAGSITASGVVAGRLGRVDARLLTAVGLALAACGMLGIGLAPAFSLTIAASVLLGVGDGLVVAATHSLVTATADHPARDINRLNVWFAVGAVIGPLWAGATLELTEELWVTYAGLAAFVALASAYVWRRPSVHAPHDSHTAIHLGRAIALMGAVLFLYVGAEIGLGAWVASYTEKAAEASVMASAAVTSGYWGALALGRVATGRALRMHDAGALLAIAIAAAGTSALILAVFGEVLAVAFVAAIFTGLAFGPIWPLAISIGAGQSTPSTMAAMVTLGNSGALVFPVIQGAVLASAGPQEGVAVTPALCLAMLLLVLSRRWLRV